MAGKTSTELEAEILSREPFSLTEPGKTPAELEAEILSREPFSLTEQEYKDVMVGLLVKKARWLGFEDQLSAEDFGNHFTKEVPTGKEQLETMLGKFRGLSDEQFKATLEFVKANIHPPTETVSDERLKARSSPLPPPSEEAIQEWVGKVVDGRLDMREYPKDDDAYPDSNGIDAMLLEIAARCGDLRNIELLGSYVTDRGLKALHNCKKLQIVQLMFCWEVSDAGVAELGRALCGQLTYLNVRGNNPPMKVTSKTVVELVDICKNLEGIHADVGSDEGWIEAAKALEKAGFTKDRSCDGLWEHSSREAAAAAAAAAAAPSKCNIM